MATPALMQTRKSPEVHDVVIIGSGAPGGMAAWNLTRQGMRVLMLDAGAKFERSQFWSHVKPWQAPQKLAAGQKPPQFYVDLKTAPYQTHEGLNLTPRTGTFYFVNGCERPLEQRRTSGGKELRPVAACGFWGPSFLSTPASFPSLVDNR
jgi:choline dehydrogenase-like flavoprotein